MRSRSDQSSDADTASDIARTRRHVWQFACGQVGGVVPFHRQRRDRGAHFPQGQRESQLVGVAHMAAQDAALVQAPEGPFAPQGLQLPQRAILKDGFDAHQPGPAHIISGKADLAAVDVKAAAVRPMDTGQNLDQGRFAGPVIAQKPQDLARKKVDLHMFEELGRVRRGTLQLQQRLQPAMRVGLQVVE